MEALGDHLRHCQRAGRGDSKEPGAGRGVRASLQRPLLRAQHRGTPRGGLLPHLRGQGTLMSAEVVGRVGERVVMPWLVRFVLGAAVGGAPPNR